jgi:hypothetical protein
MSCGCRRRRAKGRGDKALIWRPNIEVRRQMPEDRKSSICPPLSTEKI